MRTIPECEFYEDWRTNDMNRCQYFKKDLCTNTDRNLFVQDLNQTKDSGLRPFVCPIGGKANG